MQMNGSDSSEDYYDSSDEEMYIDQAGGLVESGAVPQHLLQKMPHKAIGMITFEHHTQTSTQHKNGSGFLIAPNLVATVAHVIYDPKEKKFNKNISFTLGSNSRFQRTVKVLECKVPEEYKQLHPSQLKSKFSVKYDYALLKLQQQIKLPEYFVFIDKFNNDLEKLSIYGYPNTKKHKIGVQNGHQGEISTSILKVDNILMRIKHNLPTFNGHSGSPILISDREVVGIHKSAIYPSDYLNSFFNCAVLINSQMIKSFIKWGKEFNKSKETNFEVREYFRQRSISHSKVLAQEFLEVTLQNMAVIDICHRQRLPMCCVGQLTTIYKQDAKISGTAFLISDNLLVTCFTNIYNPHFENFNSKDPSLKLIFYLCFQSDRGNGYQIQDFQYNVESMSLKSNSSRKKVYVILEDFAFDFCLLKLKKKIVLPNYLGLLVNFERDGEKYKILGCPATEQFDQRTNSSVILEGLPVTKSTLKIYQDKKMACHNVETKKGMMGSPLVAFEDKVFALSKACLTRAESCRMARLVTVDLVLKLYQWNKKLKGSPFQVSYCQPQGIVKVTSKKQLESEHARWKELVKKSRYF